MFDAVGVRSPCHPTRTNANPRSSSAGSAAPPRPRLATVWKMARFQRLMSSGR